jgi:hypothetical protein
VRAPLVALLIALALPGVAHAYPFLDQGDAAELANELAEATDEQGICYGWQVSVDDQSGGPSGTDVGSNFGPGQEIDATQCP